MRPVAVLWLLSVQWRVQLAPRAKQYSSGLLAAFLPAFAVLTEFDHFALLLLLLLGHGLFPRPENQLCNAVEHLRRKK